jgi:hypothetical protein
VAVRVVVVVMVVVVVVVVVVPKIMVRMVHDSRTNLMSGDGVVCCDGIANMRFLH